MKVFNNQFNCTEKQFTTLETLQNLKAGFAKIYGYKPKTNVIEQPIYNVSFCAKTQYKKSVQRKIEVLTQLDFSNIENSIKQSNNEKLVSLPKDKLFELFELRKNRLFDSYTKTLNNDTTSNAQRIAHVRNYAEIAKGIKVNFVTEKIDGLQVPVLADNGLPTVSSILIRVRETKRETVQQGTYKTVNSGAPVLIEKIITKAVEKLSNTAKDKYFSLGSDNFDRLVIDNHEIS